MSLLVDYNSLRRDIGRFADSGRSSSDWDSTQELDINDVLAKGERAFYWPDLGNGEIHRWSFLEEPIELTFASGQANYPLPTEYSSLKDRFIYLSGGQGSLAETTETEILSLISAEGKQGTPQYFAISTRPSAPGARSVREVLVYPIPDAEATVRGTMHIEPEPLSATNPYPRGGAVHSETLTEACLMMAEKVLFPEAGPGIHSQAFQVCLAKSIAEDLQQTNDLVTDIWPDDPLDEGLQTLEVNKFYLMRVIGDDMGFGPHPKAWKPNETAKVKEILRTALREFYTPQIFPGQVTGHSWSFLSPVHHLTLQAGKYLYDLPAEWGGIRGRISYAPGTNAPFPEIEVTNQRRVEELLEYTTSSAYCPTRACFRTKEASQQVGTRWEMMVSPPPSGEYEIQIPFAINPYQLTDDVSLPFGGQPHAQTMIEAARAAVEVETGEGNIHQQKFLERLRTSIDYDQQETCPRTLGVSLDRSDSYSDLGLADNSYNGDYHLTAYDNT